MFHAIRNWWSGGRARVTLRLFLFELAVVVIGVLIAQQLATFAQRRSALAQMEIERARVFYELESAHSMFQSWRVAIPCLNARMTEVMNGTTLTSADLRRPAMPTPNYTPPDNFTLNLVAERYGIGQKNELMGATDNIRTLTDRVDLVISSWGRLMLLDPANGPFRAADRDQARAAAADIKGYLRAVEVISENAPRAFRPLGIRARNNDEPETGPAKSCAAIWSSGRIDPPRTTR